MRVGILGGTFDPIHVGHLIVASCAAEQLKLDKVRFIPAGDPWRKAALTVSPAAQRLEMVRLGTAGDPRFEVDDSEIGRRGPTYTSETLAALKSTLGDVQLVFIVGEDALEDMRYWHRPELILAAARIAVAPRLDTPVPTPPVSHDESGFHLPEFDRIDMPRIGISSTDLRERAGRGQSLRYLVPDAVARYIKEQGLYRE